MQSYRKKIKSKKMIERNKEKIKKGKGRNNYIGIANSYMATQARINAFAYSTCTHA